MITQFLRKRRKIWRGIINTHFRKRGHAYNDKKWWDNYFYQDGVSDRQTLCRNQNMISAMYHYNSVETKILRHIRHHQISMDDASVLDIGSGSGHWIDFYGSLGNEIHLTGVDVSATSVDYLREKYSKNSKVQIIHGNALEIFSENASRYSIVNAIGVMFHIVNDAEWAETIQSVSDSLVSGGLFIVGGHFGLLNGLNVQIDPDGNINKRLRSRFRWRNVLRKAGFRRVRVYSNTAYLWIDDPIPENNVLVATK